MRRMTAGAPVALAVILALAACSAAPVPPESAAEPAPTTTVRPTPVIDVPVTAATPAPARQAVPPSRVVIGAIDVDMPVEAVGVETGGFMELPVNPAVGGWYRFGADPTSPDGNVVISAHVDAPQYPIGPFSRLRELSAGEGIEVTDAAGTTHRYELVTVTYYPKSDLPVADLFARVGSRDLVLITCGGEFDSATGRYADNVVAVARRI